MAIERRKLQSGATAWRARLRGPDGRERAKQFRRKIDAEDWLRKQETTKRSGSWVDPSLGRQRFGEYAETWMAGQVQLAPTTAIKVRGHLENHLVPAFGHTPLAGIRAPEIRKWQSELGESGRKPATVRAVTGTLSRVLKTATRDGVIGRNPCEDVDRPKDRTKPEMRFLTASEVMTLADTIDQRYRALIFVAAYGGLRWGEIAALKVEAIELPRGRVLIRESLADVNGDLLTQLPKSGKARQVTLPRSVAEILGEHIGHFSAGGYVFTSVEGLPLRRSNWYRRTYQPAVRASGLMPLRFHDLRHTAAALAIGSGAHPKAIQDRLGHSTIRLTLDLYGHLLPGLEEALADDLDRAFAKAAEGEGIATISALR